jgi:hypothetical protein
MSFDPRSLERLRELGRSLPKPLPKPEPKAAPRSTEPRHRLETETDPEQLFRELMQASTDGTVPPHLMERLREVEGKGRERRTLPADPPPEGAPSQPQRQRQVAIGKPDAKLAAAHGDLYTAFQQLLLEDEEEL